jgi:hypothetical protein
VSLLELGGAAMSMPSSELVAREPSDAETWADGRSGVVQRRRTGSSAGVRESGRRMGTGGGGSSRSPLARGLRRLASIVCACDASAPKNRTMPQACVAKR